jgi:tol-pal system protein YbgF
MASMMRRLALCAGLTLLALASLTPIARAQQDNRDIRPLLDRLDRLERDINLLQRQVYRGGTGSAPVPTAPPGDANSALNFEMRMGRIEDQMRTMTGQIEETSYKIEQLRQNLEKLQSDIEVRFSQLGSPDSAAVGAPPPPKNTPQPPPPALQQAYQNAPVQLHPPSGASSVDTPQLGSQPHALGMIRVPEGEDIGGAATSNPVLGSSAAQAATPGASANAASNAVAGAATPQDQYNAAFSLLRQARYEDAEQALRGFVQRYPKDSLAPAAQYWLGETFYVRKDYAGAAAAFADGYEKYPKSPKGPDFLLKLGMSLANAGQKDNACRAYQRLDRDYPQAASEIRDRSGAEKKRLGCAA